MNLYFIEASFFQVKMKTEWPYHLSFDTSMRISLKFFLSLYTERDCNFLRVFVGKLTW